MVLLHGLTASRRYVVMGSRALERSGHRVISYDARGHGRSGPAAQPEDYGYEALAQDLIAVMDHRGVERAVLAGASMGAHTLLRAALTAPQRVAGVVVITPAYAGPQSLAPARLERWDQLAVGLRERGVEGFLEAYGEPQVSSEELARTVRTVIRQRLALHQHPLAVADALQAVPRSQPFAEISALGAISAPAVIVGSSDGADPEHPLAVAQAYARAIPGASLVSDRPGASPVAWQGSQLSRIIAELVSLTR